MSESVVSAKRGWVSFGARPAQSETPVRAAAKRRPPGRGRSGSKDGIACPHELLGTKVSFHLPLRSSGLPLAVTSRFQVLQSFLSMLDIIRRVRRCNSQVLLV